MRRRRRTTYKDFRVIYIICFVIIVICLLLPKSKPPKDELRKTLKQNYSVDAPSEVMDDVTGKWMLSRYASSTQVQNIALDYYNAYFENDDQIHFVINYTLNTTGRITCMGNKLDVAVMEHIEKEELSAKTLGGGMLYSQYLIDIDTGEIDKLNLNE